MKTTRTPTQRCACGYEIDSASSVQGDATPGAGDFTFCLRCARVYRFTADLCIEAVPRCEVPDDVRDWQAKIERFNLEHPR